ncbi:MAG: hydrolase [Nocardioides sp.]|nr:hydrolase [Nocardioides sp.]
MVNLKTIDTPHGPARLHTSRSRRPIATLLVSHGAGAGVDTPDLVALARSLPPQGVTVHRLEQPWKVAGRKVATAPPTLDAALRAVANQIRPRTPMVLGGRSAGARSAARSARDLGAAGVLALSFPLHPPGRPEKSRIEELRGVPVPSLVIQGSRDPMGAPEDFPAGTNLVEIPGGDHSFKLLKSAPLSEQEVLAMIVEATLEWIVREVAGS